jgi:hypothetical protein
VNASDPRHLTVEEVQCEVAQILATGYLRLCEEARQDEERAPSQHRSGAPEGQESASAGPGERP